MSSISASLLETIKELQALPTLKESVLGGGTSLALRYDHRESVDIDLIFSDIIGKDKFKVIEQEVRGFFKDSIIGLDYPCDIDDQYVFLRFFVRKDGQQIKVEILQNMCLMYEAEIIDDVRVLSENDIGMLKLMAVSNRCSFKDVYDLKYITDEVPLANIFQNLKEKQELYNGEEHKNIFDLDDEVSPVDSPQLLLKFDEEASSNPARPNHSTHHFKIVNGISWLGAKANWRRKVIALIREIGA